MDKEKLKTIISDYKNQPNKELVLAMDYLNDDFEKTKKLIIDLSKYLDLVENQYRLVHTEYTQRIKA